MASFFCVVFKYNDEINVFKINNTDNDGIKLYNFLLSEVNGLKGYNNISYDSQLIQFIMLNKGKITAQQLYAFSQRVIDAQYPIFRENELYIFNLDIYKILHLDNKNRMVGLKWCEFMTDWHNIEDMPHHHSKHLNEQEEEETVIYCLNDVEATEHLFNLNKKEIALRIDIGSKYNMNFMNASNSKIGSELLLKLYCERTGKNPRIVRKMRTERSSIILGEVIFNYIKFDCEQFSSFLEHMRKVTVRIDKDQKKNEKIKLGSVNIKGFSFDFGLGGIHGSLKNKTVLTENSRYLIIDCDVSSLYPSIGIVNNLYPEHLGPEFAQVYNEDIVSVRLAEKAKKEQGDKSIINGFKEAANSAYGKSKDFYSWMYDPKYTYSITINGQLMLCMLAEKLMLIPDSQIIQINTDGITMRIPKEYEQQYYDICKEWQEITRLELEYANYEKMLIRDVNNYIAIYDNGKTKCKGFFEFENLPLHKNKSALIIPITIFNWFVKGIPIEETLYNHKNLLDFCLGSRNKAGSKFFYLDKQGKEYNLSKTIRYYISTQGVVIKKRFDDGRTSFLNVHPLKGKTFYQTVLNKYTQDQVTDLNNINYSFYLHKINEEIEQFKTKLTLF